MAKPNEELIAACEACVRHARDLVEAAKLVQSSRRANIAFHLATLALEEMGRRELFQIQNAAATVGEVPSWQINATQDHVQKLFWCFYRLAHLQEIVDQKEFFERKEAAADIHALRLLGLYVDNSETGLKIPASAISGRQSEALISLAEATIGQAEQEKPRETIPREDIELQTWFLRAFDDPDKRARIMSKQSLDKLGSIGDVAVWAGQIKDEIERDETDLRELAEREVNRDLASLGSGEKDRWRVQIRICTSSNSIRPKPLKKWNEGSAWIKLRPQQGASSKNEMFVEITLGDDVHVGSLLPLTSQIAFNFIVAINMATSGFWWWPLAPNRERIYEQIQDLENKNKRVELDDPSFNIFQRKQELTDIHLQNLTLCLVALPRPNDHLRAPAYMYYAGGLNFIALNSVQWRCEGQAFGNFLESLRLLMVEARYVDDGEPVDISASRLLKQKYANFDPSEHDAFIQLVRAFDRRSEMPTVRISDVFLLKALCEHIFRDAIVPAVIKGGRTNDAASDSIYNSREI
jgi:AbiV family abortive infection protein